MSAKKSKPKIVMILILAKINSASPYILTAKMFRQTMRTMTIVIQGAGLMSGAQNAISVAAAEISEH